MHSPDKPGYSSISGSNSITFSFSFLTPAQFERHNSTSSEVRKSLIPTLTVLSSSRPFLLLLAWAMTKFFRSPFALPLLVNPSSSPNPCPSRSSSSSSSSESDSELRMGAFRRMLKETDSQSSAWEGVVQWEQTREVERRVWTREEGGRCRKMEVRSSSGREWIGAIF